MQFKIDETYLIETTQKLVQIDSTNPSLSTDGAGETEIAIYVDGEMKKLGLDVKRREVAPGRENVVGVLKGSGGGRSLLLNAHLDTVGVEGMAEPFSGDLRDERIYGRGSQDMKASIAAMLAATKAIVDAEIQLAGDLLVTFVADEENLSIGMEALIEEYGADAAIVTEPTEMQPCLAHRGFILFDVEIYGRAAHGSRYMDGVDANVRMGRFLVELEKLGKDVLAREPHPLAGPASLHAALVQGGTELFTYADKATATIEWRTIPGETVEGCQAELQLILDGLAEADSTFKGQVKATFWRYPFEIRRDAAIVQQLDAVLESRLGDAPVHIGQTFWTDAALLAEVGIDSVLLGPIGHGLHSAEEWVDVQSVIDLAYVLAETTIGFCGA